ncbi:MAG: 16S rRNA (cytidine(1402)-2'-O)-methyltransferase [Chloroflexi bacterium]|nr:16S rRNA (cytidine(1402)-2'-O)-methyltransferase [Chloroflexota bacterium]
MGTLFVVGTPIGNLEDVTPRALRVLREVGLIAAEDTRVTRTLLRHYEIETPMVSFHEFSGPGKVRHLVERLAQQDVALVSDAGMPGLSDPGYPLIRAALDAGHTIVPVPGPSAILSALVASGLPMHAFTFLGFLPRKSAERQRLFASLRDATISQVVFESPHRVSAALDDLVAEVGPDRPIAVARELTKKFEEIVRGPAGEVAAEFRRRAPRGEFTLVIGPAPADRRSREERGSSAGHASSGDPGAAIDGRATSERRHGKRRSRAAERMAHEGDVANTAPDQEGTDRV